MGCEPSSVRLTAQRWSRARFLALRVRSPVPTIVVIVGDPDHLVLLELIEEESTTGRVPVVLLLPAKDEPSTLIALIVVEDDSRRVPAVALEGLAIANRVGSTRNPGYDEPHSPVRLDDVDSFYFDLPAHLQGFDASAKLRQLIFNHQLKLTPASFGRRLPDRCCRPRVPRRTGP